MLEKNNIDSEIRKLGEVAKAAFIAKLTEYGPDIIGDIGNSNLIKSWYLTLVEEAGLAEAMKRSASWLAGIDEYQLEMLLRTNIKIKITECDCRAFNTDDELQLSNKYTRSWLDLEGMIEEEKTLIIGERRLPPDECMRNDVNRIIKT